MAEKLPIPVFDSLADVYPSQGALLREGKRWNDIVSTFEERYGSKPTHIVRAPGRVNILGEHIDYSLFPVLPAAIEQDIVIALRPSSSSSDIPQVKLSNIQANYKASDFALTPPSKGNNEWHVDFISPAEGGGWENYMKVAMAECLAQFYGDGHKREEGPRGMELLVSGTVPPGSGLSSSAGFVVGAVITFLVANNLTSGISKGDVVALAMASEHRMGLRTGGMDQAASALCLPNTLLHLSFHPSLTPVPLPLPSSVGIIITNSYAPHQLTDSAPIHYNLRVVEILCATRLLIHAWGLSEHPKVKGMKGEEGRLWLKEVLELWNESLGGKMSEEEVYAKGVEEAKRILGAGGKEKEGWSREEMMEASGMSKDNFTQTYLKFLEIRAEKFYLYQRTLHTLTESLRVFQFTQLCRSLSPSGHPENIPESDPRLKQLGEYLTASGESLRDVYECTVPQTDELTELCLKSGALGARQTGGGWGGAIISLVPVSKSEEFLATVKKQFRGYAGKPEAEINESAFATLPGSGAGIYVVQDGIRQ